MNRPGARHKTALTLLVKTEIIQTLSLEKAVELIRLKVKIDISPLLLFRRQMAFTSAKHRVEVLDYRPLGKPYKVDWMISYIEDDDRALTGEREVLRVTVMR